MRLRTRQDCHTNSLALSAKTASLSSQLKILKSTSASDGLPPFLPVATYRHLTLMQHMNCHQVTLVWTLYSHRLNRRTRMRFRENILRAALMARPSTARGESPRVQRFLLSG